MQKCEIDAQPEASQTADEVIIKEEYTNDEEEIMKIENNLPTAEEIVKVEHISDEETQIVKIEEVPPTSEENEEVKIEEVNIELNTNLNMNQKWQIVGITETTKSKSPHARNKNRFIYHIKNRIDNKFFQLWLSVFTIIYPCFFQNSCKSAKNGTF